MFSLAPYGIHNGSLSPSPAPGGLHASPQRPLCSPVYHAAMSARWCFIPLTAETSCSNPSSVGDDLDLSSFTLQPQPILEQVRAISEELRPCDVGTRASMVRCTYIVLYGVTRSSKPCA
ncbi:hypothetical protein E2C01_014760 [Portunus trituberculatus]|uniref:Uncharacterized protein n=1 Tax=Portunus trituberculatus TaxID=210409 RepID=A0A5B7DLB7_PORTR|nr:hypothetical protein [Portunus trituberculatus]